MRRMQERIGVALCMLVCLVLPACASLPPNTPTTFRTYANASHQRIDTLHRTATGLNLERSRARDAVSELERAVGAIDLTKPMNDETNKANMNQISEMIAVLKELSKPDGEVNGTLARIESDLTGLSATADVIHAVLTEVATQHDNAGGVLDAATRVITDLNKRNEEASKDIKELNDGNQ